ncbi:PaaI family thioesterase [Halomicrococcus sp. NG-SE-24]|uniref:PaaI family thioesterase n=1 Tax=Halomicrococcus sp. NG-SE-24 TaxID=3436928 RepID=UPI003D981992
MSQKRTDDAAEIVQQYIDERHSYLSWLGARVEKIEHGEVVVTIPFDERLTNKPPKGADSDPELGPQIHGGVAATLIDTAGGIALRPFLDDPFSGKIATVNLNVNYLRPATDDLTATAEVIRAGSTIGVSTITVESEQPGGDTQPVAIGHGAYRMFRSAGE